MNDMTTAAATEMTDTEITDTDINTTKIDATKIQAVTEMTDTQISDVFANARTAAGKLRQTSLEQRAQALHGLIDHINANREAIADAIVADTHKSRTDAVVSEIMGVLDNLEWLMQQAPKLLASKKVKTPITLMGKKSIIHHEPHGVVLVISPWNYPFHIGLTSVMAAFVAGNAVLFKPSEVTPLTGLFEQIFAQHELVASSVFICYGGGETAQKLIAQRPDKIFFTGSTRTGKRILNQAADMLIPVDLELGGKDPAIVFDDVNLQRAVAGVMWGGLTTAGQSCSSVERIYVHERIYDDFIKRLSEEVDKLIVSYGDAGNADVGAITAPFQVDIIEQHVNDARDKGAIIHTGGARLEGDASVYLPTVLSNLSDDMLITYEETFGPVLPVMSFSDEAEVIERANASEFGLSASVWSDDLDRAQRVAAALDCGAVSINNVMITEGNPWMSFGGVKNSGYGRQKGEEGLLSYARSKSVMVDKNSGKIEANWYPYTQKKYGLFAELLDTLFSHSPLKLIKLAIVGTQLESEAKKPRHE